MTELNPRSVLCWQSLLKWMASPSVASLTHRMTSSSSRNTSSKNLSRALGMLSSSRVQSRRVSCCHGTDTTTRACGTDGRTAALAAACLQPLFLSSSLKDPVSILGCALRHVGSCCLSVKTF
ncbi:hypothetical protein B0H17DRAFT_705056 [Mycena rosella]|uniref:Uncharacterized protein n=1 Tax=Mycena rosella TaxID=1033263 RepID=A0AAD7DDK0_MYCRO|nr:hypothetical protein B0H17DRAFT_705056 [Mycena rosella]